MNTLPYLDPSDSLELLLRLVAATLIGGLIGLNRQIEGKSAGLRTHMLVSLGSALLVMIPMQMSNPPSHEAVSRTIQGIAAGIGFLGGGEILHQSFQGRSKTIVKGLTSAAAIWTTAALGMMAGCGLWLTSLLGTLLVWVVLTWMKRLEMLIGIKPRPR